MEELLLMLARRLYARRQTGIVVPYKMVDVRHREFDCHQNAGIWARDNPGCKVIHGWMVFDHERTSLGLVSLVNFNPHSVIETDDGERYGEAVHVRISLLDRCEGYLHHTLELDIDALR